MIGDDDTRRELVVLGIVRDSRTAELSRELVQLVGAHAVVNARAYLLSDFVSVDRGQIFGQQRDATKDLVERDRLDRTIALAYIHNGNGSPPDRREIRCSILYPLVLSQFFLRASPSSLVGPTVFYRT